MKIVLNADDNILPAVPWYRVYWFDYDTKDQFVSWFEMLRLCEVAGQPQLLAVGTAYQTINDLPYGGIYLVWINPENGSEITYGAGLPKRFLLCDPGGILKTYEGRALSQELNGNFWISGFAEPGHFGGGGMKDAFLLRIPKDWVPGKPFWYQEYGDNFVIPVEQQDFGWGVQAYQVAGEVYAVLTGYTAARHYPGGSRDLWFLCVDESGAPVWENHYGTAGGDCGNSLAVLPDGSFLAAGFAGENATNPRNLYLVWTDDHFGSAAFYAGSITAEMITPASVIRGQPIRFTDVVFTNSGCGTNFIISIKAGRELPDGTYGFAAQLKTTPVTALTGQSLVFPTVVLNTATVIPGNYRFTFQVKAENETIPFIESQPFDVAVE
jgi:hypothetical protein